jgi:xanthine dehydrogenase molybdopterin-binding subunit B
VLQDAIAKSSFYPSFPPGPFDPPSGGIVKGDVNAALEGSAHIITGTVTVGGQKHFYMEVQNAVAGTWCASGIVHIAAVYALFSHPQCVCASKSCFC